MHKLIIVKKIRIGLIFPRAVLYSRKNIVGLGLIKLSTAIVILAYKLCIGNLRENTRIIKLIRRNKEIVIINPSTLTCIEINTPTIGFVIILIER